MEKLSGSDSLTSGAAHDVIVRLNECAQGQDFRRMETLADEAQLAAAIAGHDAALSAAAAECRAQADYHLNRHPTALRAFAEAIRRWHALGDAAGEARSRIGRSGLLSQCGLTTESLEEGHAALALLDRGSDLALRVGALLAIARGQTVLRAWQVAERLYARALAMARDRPDAHETSRVLVDLGYFYCERSREARAMGDGPALHRFAREGLTCDREALAHFRSRGQSKLEWIALINMAESLMDLGRHAEARATIDEVLRSVGQSTAPSPYCQCEALLALGQVSLAQARPDQATVELQRAFEIAQTHGMNDCVMKSRELLTLACEATGDFKAAIAHHRAFFAVHVQIVSEAARLRASALAIALETAEAHAAVVTERERSRLLTQDNLELQRESLKDSMTGLPNHRAFERAFARNVEESAKTGIGFFLAVIDVDDFKAVNDRYSHSIGDSVLRTLALLLRDACREADFAARYGGEEFTLILASRNLAAAASACERVRRTIEAHAWSVIGEGLAVTVSIGVVASSECAAHSVMFEIADRRLYRAKTAGKNRVVATDD